MVGHEMYPKDAIRALQKLGFYILHQKGSHFRLAHEDGRRVTIAVHPKPFSVGTLHSVLRQAEITRKELDELL
jgi:predicted RNA binding protein YcfA (HicA-like mRNA interferase family)